MSEFKVGDRVRYETNYYRASPNARGEGVIVAIGLDTNHRHGEFEVRGQGQTLSYRADELTLVQPLADWEKELLGGDQPEAALPKFKVGDRVRAERSGASGTRPRGTWVEGVVVGNDGLEHSNEISIKRDDGGHHTFVYADTAQLLPLVGKGDRVRAIREVTVTSLATGGYYAEDEAGFSYFFPSEVTTEVVERAKPEPFKPGTFVTSEKGSLLPMARTDDGKWLNVRAGVETVYDDAAIRSMIERDLLVATYEPATT